MKRRSFLEGLMAFVAMPSAIFSTMRYPKSGLNKIQVPGWVKQFEVIGTRQMILDGSIPNLLIRWSHDGKGSWTLDRFPI